MINNLGTTRFSLRNFSQSSFATELENRNTNTKRTPQKPLTSKSLPNDHLIKVVILGDSIVKHVNGWKMSRKLKNCRVKVMSFSGATSAMYG